MRLIDAEYLLYGLGMFSEKENGAEFIKGVDAVADMIESAETISPAADWTPCSVALPNKEGEYAVTYQRDKESFRRRGTRVFTFKFGGHWETSLFDTVIAWQPLPETYQGEA